MLITALARADCKGGVCTGSVDYYQFVARLVVPDRMGKRYGLFACYSGIDATTLELIDEFQRRGRLAYWTSLGFAPQL